MSKKYFEDLIEGEKLNCKDVFFSQIDIIDFAKKFDPQPFHIDECIAKKSILFLITIGSTQ
ncbi:hypothetical protein KAJ27_20560 [bacterium]|nr:hypothetical protein [bacterium]